MQRRTGNRHAEGTDAAVSAEADDVQAECDTSIQKERRHFERRHLVHGVVAYSGELAGEVRKENALGECKRRKEEKEVQGVTEIWPRTRRLKHVRKYCFEGR